MRVILFKTAIQAVKRRINFLYFVHATLNDYFDWIFTGRMICVCAYTENGMWMLRDPYEYYNGPLSTLSKSFVICNLRILITSQFLMVDVSAYMIVFKKNLNIFVFFFKYQHFLKKGIAIKILFIVEIFLRFVYENGN